MNTLASAITTFDQNKIRLGNKWNKQVEVVVDGVTKIVSCLINICLLFSIWYQNICLNIIKLNASEDPESGLMPRNQSS